MASIKDYKICIFGDSVSKGVYIEDGNVKKIEKNAVTILEEHFDINIINNSVFGQTLKRIYDKKLIDRYLQAMNKDDKNIVILSIGGNDCDFDWENVAKTPNELHESRTDINDFTKYLEEITLKLLENKVQVFFTTLFPIDSKRYFYNIISKNYAGEEILKFLNDDISNLTRHQECFNERIIKTANKYHLPVIDIRTPFLMDTCFLRNLSLDGIHPNEEGQKEIASLIIKHINKLVD